DVRRLSVVYASGLSMTQSSSSAVGLGVSDGGDLGLAGGAVSTRGIQETALSKAAAPPTPMAVSMASVAAIGCLAGLLAAAVVGMVVHTQGGANPFAVPVWAVVTLLSGRIL